MVDARATRTLLRVFGQRAIFLLVSPFLSSGDQFTIQITEHSFR